MVSIAKNRKAYHDYTIEDTFEAGIVLTGTEIKSVRKGHVQLKESFISIRDGEAYVKGMHIAQYDHGNIWNHEEVRDRKLLLHKHQIQKLAKEVQLQGYTIVPLHMYLSKGRAKLEIGVAKGKHLYDKRQSDKERSMKREAQRASKQRYD